MQTYRKFKTKYIGIKKPFADDSIVQQSAITNLGRLAKTPQASRALEVLLEAANSWESAILSQAAIVLRHFNDPRAQAALMKLRQDSDYRVVGATLEGLV